MATWQLWQQHISYYRTHPRCTARINTTAMSGLLVLLTLWLTLVNGPTPIHALLERRPLVSAPPDPFSSPKYNVVFYNGLDQGTRGGLVLPPISRQEAEKWMVGLNDARERSLDQEQSQWSLDFKGRHEPSSSSSSSGVTWEQVFTSGHHPAQDAVDAVDAVDADGSDLDQLLADPTSHALTPSTYPRFITVKLPTTSTTSRCNPPRLAYPRLDTDHQNVTDHARRRRRRRVSMEDDEYLCLLPSTRDTEQQQRIKQAKRSKDAHDKQDDTTTTTTTTQPDGLQVYNTLMSPENGCIYHTEGWFTYAYCHNSHIRQFRAKRRVTDPHVVEENENYDGYDLGIAPALLEQRLQDYKRAYESLEQQARKAKLANPTPAHQKAIDVALAQEKEPYVVQINELGRVQSVLDRDSLESQGRSLNADKQKKTDTDTDTDERGARAERYLRHSLSVQANAQARYLRLELDGGTVCDMTGRARRTSVEFYCAADGPDHIASIHEVASCQYVMTIKTSRLCHLSGFFVPSESSEPVHPIQCRKIVDHHARLNEASSLDGDVKDQMADPESTDQSSQGASEKQEPANDPDESRNQEVFTPPFSEVDEEELVMSHRDGPKIIVKPRKLVRKAETAGTDRRARHHDSDDPTKRAATLDHTAAAAAAVARKRALIIKQREQEKRLAPEILKHVTNQVEAEWERDWNVRLKRWMYLSKQDSEQEKRQKRMLIEARVKRLEAAKRLELAKRWPNGVVDEVDQTLKKQDGGGGDKQQTG